VLADPVLGHLVIYTPEGENFFCVEPVSHSVDAFNLAEAGVPDTGTVVLDPGESLRGRVEFVPEF
jgi:aldose 1-epimerase